MTEDQDIGHRLFEFEPEMCVGCGKELATEGLYCLKCRELLDDINLDKREGE